MLVTLQSSCLGVALLDVFFLCFEPQKNTSKLLRTDDLFVIKSWIALSVFLGGWFSVIREDVAPYNTSLHTFAIFYEGLFKKTSHLGSDLS